MVYTELGQLLEMTSVNLNTMCELGLGFAKIALSIVREYKLLVLNLDSLVQNQSVSFVHPCCPTTTPRIWSYD